MGWGCILLGQQWTQYQEKTTDRDRAGINTTRSDVSALPAA